MFCKMCMKLVSHCSLERKATTHLIAAEWLNEWCYCYCVGLVFYNEKGQNKRDLDFLFFSFKNCWQTGRLVDLLRMVCWKIGFVHHHQCDSVFRILKKKKWDSNYLLCYYQFTCLMYLLCFFFFPSRWCHMRVRKNWRNN